MLPPHVLMLTSLMHYRCEKPSTLKAVRSATWHTGKLLFDAGSEVKVLSWDLPHKGVDDLLVAMGEDYFEKIFSLAPTFAEWQWFPRWMDGASCDKNVIRRADDWCARPPQARARACQTEKRRVERACGTAGDAAKDP